jgi:hypothetical protein
MFAPELRGRQSPQGKFPNSRMGGRKSLQLEIAKVCPFVAGDACDRRAPVIQWMTSPSRADFSSHSLNDKAPRARSFFVIYWMTTLGVVRRQRRGFLVIH